METKAIAPVEGLDEMIKCMSVYKEIVGVGELKGLSFGENGKHPVMEKTYCFDAVLILRGLAGKAILNLDYTAYEIVPGSMLIVLPIHTLQMVYTTLDFKASLLLVHKSFVEECNMNNTYLSLSNYMNLRKRPFMSFTSEEAATLDKCTQELQYKIELKTHAFHREVIKNTFSAYLLELANIMNQRKEKQLMPTLSRKEELVNRFFQLVLRYCKVEHTTTFYADKLCITPQYLSAILKEMTGKPANYWISDALITEAKIELRKPQVTVQEVAYTLNFSDQSSFGKFFKKGIGLSPSQYRMGSVG